MSVCVTGTNSSTPSISGFDKLHFLHVCSLHYRPVSMHNVYCVVCVYSTVQLISQQAHSQVLLITYRLNTHKQLYNAMYGMFK